MITDDIRKELLKLQDTGYRKMQVTTIPTVDADSIIGVRTPALRNLAKELSKRDDISLFLNELPHKYFEENQLHAFILSGMKDALSCIKLVDVFLPYVDNWATCDQMSPKVFKRHREELLGHIKEWIKSEETYTVRFGVKMLMDHFLDDDFDPGYPHMVAKLRSDEYYVNMMIAWYFATALAKQYERVLPYIEEKRLDDWTHNKAIQKSIESRRIPNERKTYLRSLRIKR
jgi:3-methyladenine DNA glycosylase AlkD